MHTKINAADDQKETYIIICFSFKHKNLEINKAI